MAKFYWTAGSLLVLQGFSGFIGVFGSVNCEPTAMINEIASQEQLGIAGFQGHI